MKRIIVIVFFLLFTNRLFSQDVLTLEECRNLAIQNNKELQIAKEKVNAAQFKKKAAFTKYFPQLSATGAYLWNEKDLNLLDMGSLSSSINSALGPLAQLPIFSNVIKGIDGVQHLDIENVWVGDVSLVQPIFMGGKLITYNKIMDNAKELAEAMNDLQLQNVIYLTDETYWQVISLINKKKLADAYVGLLRKMDHDVNALIKEGIATEADGLSVKVKLNQAEMTQTKVTNGLSLSRMLLAQICGLPIDKEQTLADENIEQLTLDKGGTSTDVNRAFANRKELQSLALAQQIYKKKEWIAMSDMLPNIALSANYLVTNPNVMNGFKNKFKGMFSVGVMVKVPLSQWWEGTYKRNEAKVQTRIASLQWEDARDKIELQVNQSIYKVNEANKKLIASKNNREKAEENLRHANLGFEEGIIPALNLMEAQTAWLSAQSDLIDAQIEVKLTNVYLRKSLGELK